LEASTDVEENYDYSVEDIFKESWFVASQVFMDQAQKTYFSVMGEPRVQGPKNALLTIFVELISNTLQHSVSRDTKGNKVEIRVKCRRKKGVLEITYENNGIPVPAKIHDKMFDPFTRGRTSTENMGIGLHIVSYLLSTLFNGRISYTYREGRNCFLLSFEEQGQSSGRKNG
jgi:signal transduction histidine kinase